MKDIKQSKKILLVTQYFYPENFKSNDIAFELVNKGYNVTVLTGIPNYPTGNFFKGYGFFKKRVQYINGVKIIRASLIARGKANGLRLILNYMSWTLSASFMALYLALTKKYDAIFVHEPSPITQGIPAVIVKKIKRIPLYFWVLDLWPESLTSAGGITNKYILNFFSGIVKFIYKNSDKILISSKGFKKSILEKGDFENKIEYFPNWAEEIFTKECDIEYKDFPSIPEGFKIMFAGNIGESQDFVNIMQAALLLKEEKDIKFIFIGEGRKRKWVEEFLEEHKLKDTVFLLGRFPIETMPYFFSQADVMLLSLKDELIFNLTVPAKLQAYMAAGKPTVAMLNGEGANIIKEAGCGECVNAGDYNSLAKKIQTLKNLSANELKALGINANKYYKQYFDINICMENLCKIIEN